jgi:hypothetical protein
MAQSFPTVPANAEPFVERGPAPAFMVPRFGDPADLLPEAARTKLIELRQRASDAASLARSVMEAQEEQRMIRMRVQARIDQLKRARASGGYALDDDAPQVASEQAKFAKADAEYKRLNELSDLRYAQSSTHQRLAERIEKWLVAGIPGGCALSLYEGAAPVFKGSIIDAVEVKRRRLRELQADLHRVRSAPYPSSMAKQRMRAAVEAMIDAGAPNVAGLLEDPRGEISFPTKMVPARVHNSSDPAAIVFVDVPDAHGLIAWVHKDALLKALDKELTDCADDVNALTDEQRQKQEATILGDILAVEREECALIELATAQGVNVAYRDDTDPRAFLGVTLIAAPASAPANEGGWVNELIGGGR